MTRICKNCGEEINFEYKQETAYCTGCEREIPHKDTIASWTFNTRVAQLKAMHELMRIANDEEIYMTWIITGVPDEPTESDFKDIALDDEEYNECFDLFVKLIQNKDNRY